MLGRGDIEPPSPPPASPSALRVTGDGIGIGIEGDSIGIQGGGIGIDLFLAACGNNGFSQRDGQLVGGYALGIAAVARRAQGATMGECAGGLLGRHEEIVREPPGDHLLGRANG